jgi:hypothetical protein
VQIRRIILLSILLYQPVIAQTTNYIAKNGDDSNPGTEVLPWLTIQKAFNSATPGSTVYVKEGTYNEKLSVNVSGSSSGGYITFQNFGNDNVIIDGTGEAGDQIILVQNKSFIKLIGFELQNNLNQTFGTGIWVQGYGDHIEIRKNRIHDMMAAIGGGDAMGISVYGSHANIPISNIIIDSNQIYNCQPGHSESLTLNGNVDTFQITNNFVHDNDNIGIDMIGGEGTCPTSSLDAARNGVCAGNTVYNCRSNYGDGYAAGIYVDGARKIIIERNRVYQCDVGIEVGCENQGRIADSIIVRNNLIYNNDKRGLSFGGYNYPVTGQVRDSKFLNNTVFQNDQLSTGEGEIIIEYAVNCVIKNNIFCSTTQDRLMTTTVGNSNGNSLDYNLWFTPGGINNASIDYNGMIYNSFSAYQTGTGQDAHSIFSDPLFVSPSLPDLHLQTSSPAVNAGDPSFVPSYGEFDFDGNLRLSENRVDMGAYEKYISLFVSPPTLLAPADGSFGIPLVPQFRWSDSSDAVTYQLQIAFDTNFTSIIFYQSAIIDTFYTPTKLNTLTRYFWRVRGNVNSLLSDWSGTWSFTTTLAAPHIIDAVGLSVNPTLCWTTATSAVSYHLQISTDTSFTVLIFDDSTLVDTAKTVNGLSDNTSYYARVDAEDSNGKSEWSNILHFTTAASESLYSYQLSSGWNMISIPIKVRNQMKDFIYPSSVSDAFAYDHLYLSKDTLQNGSGYWLKFENNQRVILTGVPLMDDTVEIIEGWNMIGSISEPIAVSSINSIPSGMITRSFFKYEVSYQTTDTLYPGYGYWVKVNQDGSLILTSSEYVGEIASRIRIVQSSELPPPPPDVMLEGERQLPNEFVLNQNYPNPFNPNTTISYQLPLQSHVTLKLFDVLGREVATLVNVVEEPGYKSLTFDASRLSSGVYYYRLQAGNYIETKKLLLLR